MINVIYKTPEARCEKHTTTNMARIYLMLALLVQCSLCFAEDAHRNETESIELLPVLDKIQSQDKSAESTEENVSSIEDEKNIDEVASSKIDVNDVLLSEFRTATNDWVDMFLGSSSDLNPSSATSMMAQAANSNKSPEEQLEEIKEVASEITMAIQSEMTNLLSYALNYGDKDGEDNNRRKRRSIETPMDSSQMILKLLNHIKCSNEYQSIAIGKMLSAQEIADKFGVEFNPDPEILTDLAFAANEQAKELTSILEAACDTKNTTCISEGSNTKNSQEMDTPQMNMPELNTTYVFLTDYPDSENMSTPQGHEHTFQPTWDTKHIHYGENDPGYNYYNYHCENQVQSPPVQYSYGSSVTPKPTFYDTISYNPNDYYSPYCSVDPMPLLPFYSYDDPLELEPELVGEEYEETVTSKVIIEQDEDPGSATVNHVMTYTVSEKSHFRTPQIEKLPQQMQYYFFLM